MKSTNGLVWFGLGIFGVSLWAGLTEIALMSVAMIATIAIVEYINAGVER